ncbi:MAG: hydrogenase maturation nickel metallochaperone HypA [Collinsella sp.]|nr:hydrogenase maturation nickel metallochaperone HypA [Collinsella sp.]
MHEVGIVNGILDTVIRAARGAGASRAVLVTLRIGDMTEVVREALDFATAASSISRVSKSKPPTISPLTI